MQTLVRTQLVVWFLWLALPILKATREDAGEEDEEVLNGGMEDEAAAEALGGLGDEEEEDAYEWVSIADNVGYLGPLLRLLALSHTLISFAMLVAYYVLKVSSGCIGHIISGTLRIAINICTKTVF